MMRRFLTAALVLTAAMAAHSGEILDRLAATVNGHAVLQSDVDEELRYECFAAKRPLSQITAEDRKAALNRLHRDMAADGAHRFDFSFSGLKTAVARWVEQRERDGEPVPVPDVAAAFQEAVVDVLTRKAVLAAQEHGVGHLVLGGGVAANSRLRAVAEQRCAEAGIRLRVPRPGLCTDNGAMVAALGAELVRRGHEPSALDHAADSSMPVTQVLA